MKKETFEDGYKKGVQYAKREALKIICDCEKMTGHDYISVWDAINEIEEEPVF